MQLFGPEGVDLGLSWVTGTDGRVSSLLPEGHYRVRVEDNGEEYWSEDLYLLPYELNSYELQIGEILSQNSIHNPQPQRFHGAPPVYRPLLATSATSLTGLLARIAPQAIERDEPVAYWYITDHLGTAQLVVDATGQVVWRGDYRPFGDVTVSVELLDNRFRFPGQLFDPESGLHYNWHRFYDPETGRYVSADPIGLAGGMNLYAYANQNPITFIDPKGLSGYLYGTPGELGSEWPSTAKCPSSPPVGNPDWVPYHGDATWFHCGYKCYHEKREPCPENPIAECCYDKGKLVTSGACTGTPNQYPSDDWWNHTFNDSGGIWEHGWDAFWESRDHDPAIDFGNNPLPTL